VLTRSQNFYELLAARALVGIGEASYVTMAPSIIADMYPEVSFAGPSSIPAY
jgi:MFS family permease